MKSSFLVTLVLTAMVTDVAFAQVASKKAKPQQAKKTTVKTKVVKKTVVAPKAPVAVAQPETKSNFKKFYDRLKISYFAALSTPNFRDIKDGQWSNAAISPQWDLHEDSRKSSQKNRDTVPTNIYNQVSFNYNYGGKMNFVVNPRFTLNLGHPRDLNFPEDKGFFQFEDALVGFQGVILSSSDKKLNVWVRPGIRLPVSKVYRNSNNGGDGKVNHQIDLSYSVTYDLSKSLQFGVSGQYRHWVIDDNYSFRRVRVSTNPYVQYTLNDVSNLQLHYENSIETDSRGQGKTDIHFDDKWQNVMIGYARDVTPKLNVMPFLGVFVDDAPISDRSLWSGLQVSYQIK